MPSIAIHQIDASAQRRLYARAEAHGRTMEEEARDILHRAVKDDPEPEVPERENIGLALRRELAAVGWWDEFDPPPRDIAGEPPKFE